MPSHANVQIHYGPYESCGITDHYISRLEGMLMVLEREGHKIQLEQIKDRNVVEVWVNGEMVFKCDIRNLDYGGDGKLDQLCTDCARAVKKAY